MIGDNIFYDLFVSNFEIKFLKEDPMNKSGPDILLEYEISKRRMIGEYGGFDQSRYGRNFSKVNTTTKNSFSVVM